MENGRWSPSLSKRSPGSRKSGAEQAHMLDDGHSLENIEARNGELREQLAAQQLRTFSRWWNSVLARRTIGTPMLIHDLCEEVRSGELAIVLLEELLGTHVRVPHPHAQTRFQMLENQNHFLMLLKRRGLRLVNIGAEDLVDGKRTMLLGLSWTLILRFEIQRYGANELELMQWVKESIYDYHVDVSSWEQSFSNGLAFTALIHEYAPEAYETQFAAHATAEPLAMLRSAFSLAEEHLCVPRLLDEEELARGVADKRSVITYVAKLRHSCIERRLEQQRRESAKVEMAQAAERESWCTETQRLVEKLQRESTALIAWTIDQEARFVEGATIHDPTECVGEAVEATGGAVEAGSSGAPTHEAMVQREEQQHALAAELDTLRHDFRAREKPARFAGKIALSELNGELLLRRQMAARAAPELGLSEAERSMTVLAAKAEFTNSALALVQRHWLRMEMAEREYETKIVRKLAAIDAAASRDAAAAMLIAFRTCLRAQKAWAEATSQDMKATAQKVECDQETKEEWGGHFGSDDVMRLQAYSAALAHWLIEKAAQRAERAKLQQQYANFSEHCEREGQLPLQEEWCALESAWKALVKSSAELQVAITEYRRLAQQHAASAETDAIGIRNEREARTWLTRVDEATTKLVQAVDASALGKETAEREQLLERYRSEGQRRRQRFVDQRAAIETTRHEVEANRKDASLSPYRWQPPCETLEHSSRAPGPAECAYEGARLHMLGLCATGKGRLGRVAMREQALSLLAYELPQLVIRKQRAREAETEVCAICAEAEMLCAWAVARAKAHTQRLRTLGKACEESINTLITKAEASADLALATPKLPALAAADTSPLPNAQMDLPEILEIGSSSEKKLRGAERLALSSRLRQAMATCQLQRTPATSLADGAAALLALDATWEIMERAEGALTRAVYAQKRWLQGPFLAWQRLRRGCRRLQEWMCNSKAVRECDELPASEIEAVHLLSQAETVAYETRMHARTLETQLMPLLRHLDADAELGASAAASLAQVASVGAMVAPMAARVATLAMELERQRRRARVQRTYSSVLAGLEQSIELACELINFPIDTVDTAETVAAALDSGSSQSASLLALECPTASGALCSHGEILLAEWQEVAIALQLRKAGCERAKRNTLHVMALRSQLDSATTAFAQWHTRCSGLLRLRPAKSVAAADVRRATAIVRAQFIEGEAYQRSAAKALRQLGAMPDGTEAATTSESALWVPRVTAMQDELPQLRNIAAAMEAAADLAPPLFNAVQPVAIALSDLADSAEPPEPLSMALLEAVLPPMHVYFLADEISAASASAWPKILKPSTFDPFPADRAPMTPLRLPASLIAPGAHGVAVIEKINQARTQPAHWGEVLAAELRGSCDGTSFRTLRVRDGSRLRTVEGEAAVRSLCKALREAKAVPALRNVSALTDVAQQLADELAAGKCCTPLLERLRKRGMYCGSAGEVVIYGVGSPETVVAELLISDGDAQQRNRNFLLNGGLRAAGVGLAAHPKHGTVCAVTLVSLFATPLAERETVECQGELSPNFLRVLEALPSEQARAIATDALAKGKRVRLQYQPGAVRISVIERDGSSSYSSLKWI